MATGSQGGAFIGPKVGQPQLEPTTVLTTSQALVVTGTQTYILSGSAAITITFVGALPPVGTVLTFVCGTNFAHIVSTATLMADGVTGAPHSKWTAAAFVGSSCILQLMPSGLYALLGNVAGAVS